MNRSFIILFSIITTLVYGARDPFWPIDYVPIGEQTPEEEDTPEPPPSGLSAEELRARTEQQIKDALNRKATVVSGGKVSALVNGKLVSQGDTLTIKSGGQTFQLRVKILTTDNIILEPIR